MRSRLLETLTFAAVALIAVAGGLPAGRVIGQGYDTDATLWMFWWFQRSAAALESPLYSDLMFHPDGHNLFAEMGGNFLDTAFSLPFAWIFGQPDWQPWYAAAVLVANAASFCWLARRLVPAGPAFAAAVAWELNPYVLYELSYGRLSQATLAFLPLAVGHFLALERQDAPRRSAPLAGLFTALHALVYWFNGYFLALVFGALAVVGLLRASNRARLLGRYVAAGAVCLALIAPAAMSMAEQVAAGEVAGISSGGSEAAISLTRPPPDLDNQIPADQGYVAVERMGPRIYLTLSAGLPTLIWILLGPGRRRWLPVWALGLVFAAGPLVDLGAGRPRLVMPHYMALWHYLPFFKRFWHPYRLLEIVCFASCLGLAHLLTRVPARLAGRAGIWAGAAAALVGLTWIDHRGDGLFPLVSRDQSAPALSLWLSEQDGAVIDLPVGASDSHYIWQTVHGRPTLGGRLDNSSVYLSDGYLERTRNAFILSIQSAATTADALPWSEPAREEMIGMGFRWIVLHRDAMPEIPGQRQDRAIVRALQGVLGPPLAVDRAMVMWALTADGSTPEIPEALRATPERLEADFERRDLQHPSERARMVSGSAAPPPETHETTGPPPPEGRGPGGPTPSGR